MNNRRSNDNDKNKLLYDPNQREQRRLGAFSNVENEDYDEDVNEEENEELENDEIEDTRTSSVPQKNNIVKNTVGKKIVSGAGAKAKALGAKVGAKIVAFIAANPWVLIVLGVVILIFIIILIVAGGSTSNGYYSQECNFNASTVNLTVLGTTYELVKGRDFTDDQIEAVMIIVKTNALSYGNYDNSSKVLELDTCTYNYNDFSGNSEYERYDELYTEIENYLYISSSYNTSIDVLTSANALELNSRTLNEISESTDRFTIILNNLYEPNADEVNEIVYTNNLFIGDSRIEEMKNYGIVVK